MFFLIRSFYSSSFILFTFLRSFYFSYKFIPSILLHSLLYSFSFNLFILLHSFPFFIYLHALSLFLYIYFVRHSFISRCFFFFLIFPFHFAKSWNFSFSFFPSFLLFFPSILTYTQSLIKHVLPQTCAAAAFNIGRHYKNSIKRKKLDN